MRQGDAKGNIHSNSWMEDSVWQQMHQMLLEGGILAQPINVSGVYTMHFLNKIYGGVD